MKLHHGRREMEEVCAGVRKRERENCIGNKLEGIMKKLRMEEA
jgi:hypothetical protein